MVDHIKQQTLRTCSRLENIQLKNDHPNTLLCIINNTLKNVSEYLTNRLKHLKLYTAKPALTGSYLHFITLIRFTQ